MNDLFSSTEASLICILFSVKVRRAESGVEHKLGEILFVDQILTTGTYCDIYFPAMGFCNMIRVRRSYRVIVWVREVRIEMSLSTDVSATYAEVIFRVE